MAVGNMRGGKISEVVREEAQGEERGEQGKKLSRLMTKFLVCQEGMASWCRIGGGKELDWTQVVLCMHVEQWGNGMKAVGKNIIKGMEDKV